MSSYWAAESGLALLLEKEETTNFLKQYLSKTFYKDAEPNELSANAIFDLIGEYSAEEFGFVKSKYADDNPFKSLNESILDEDFDKSNIHKLFNITIWNEDQYDGALFVPMEKDERCGKDKCFTFRKNDAIIIWSDKSMMPWEILNGNSYKSTDEIIEEFKEKLAVYLPDDFNWKSHIGFIEFAVFA